MPEAFADEIGDSDGKAAEMTVSDGKLVIEIARSPRHKRRYSLDKLVAGITPDKEVDWGHRVGNEVWQLLSRGRRFHLDYFPSAAPSLSGP